MSKIDLSKIEGYEAMTAEQKLAALEAYELPEPSASPANDDAAKLREALSKATGDAAEWKRKYRATLDEQKRVEEETAERNKQRDEELETLRRERTVSKYEAQYLAAGYSAELANASAVAMADGDTATVLANQAKFLADTKQRLEAEALGKQPKPTPGTPPSAGDDDKFFANVRKYAGLE